MDGAAGALLFGEEEAVVGEDEQGEFGGLQTDRVETQLKGLLLEEQEDAEVFGVGARLAQVHESRVVLSEHDPGRLLHCEYLEPTFK